MIARDFTGEDYDMLSRLDELDSPGYGGPRPGMEQGDINRLPLHLVTEAEVQANPKKSCSICLEPYQVADSLRTLACMHQFHKDCVDHWLESHSNCPICKFDAFVE